MDVILALPSHKPTAYREERCVHTSPRKQDSKVDSKLVSAQVKEYGPACFHDLMQRPCITPVVKYRFQVNVVERCAYVSYDPEDKPASSPGLSCYH